MELFLLRSLSNFEIKKFEASNSFFSKGTFGIFEKLEKKTILFWKKINLKSFGRMETVRIFAEVVKKGHQFLGNEVRVWEENEDGTVKEEFTCRMDLIASLFQKSVRFCNWAYCSVALMVYYQTGFAGAAFKKLKEFACEDKGRLAPELVKRVDELLTLFKQEYSKESGEPLSKLSMSRAEELFPRGIKYLLAAGYEVCRCHSNRSAAMLAFSGLSRAVTEKCHGEFLVCEPFHEHQKKMVDLMKWAWNQPLGKIKARPYEETVKELCKKRPGIFESLSSVLHCRLAMATAIVAIYSPPDDYHLPSKVVDVNRFDVLYELPSPLPEWVYDKHTKEGKNRISELTPLEGEDLPSLQLRHAIENSFACHPLFEYDKDEGNDWNLIGFSNYRWWDAIHRLLQEGRVRSFSLAKTNRLLAFEKSGQQVPKEILVAAREQIIGKYLHKQPQVALAVSHHQKKITVELKEAPKKTSNVQVVTSRSGCAVQYNVNHAGAFRIGTMTGGQVGNIQNASSRKRKVECTCEPVCRGCSVASSSKDSGKCVCEQVCRGCDEASSELKKKKSARKIDVSDEFIDRAHCLAQLPTRVGKQVTLFVERDGKRWWYKGPYNGYNGSLELNAELAADKVFKRLPGIGARHLELAMYKGKDWLRAPALGWPEERESVWCSLLDRQVFVAKFTEKSPVRPADAELIFKASPDLLQKIFDTQLLKWFMGFNDLVPRNLLVDRKNNEVYPCDCTSYGEDMLPDMLRTSRNVKDLFFSDRVALNTDLYRQWALFFKTRFQPKIAKRIRRFIDQKDKSVLFSK